MKEIEKEKAARLDLERIACFYSTATSNQTPISLRSMEESYYLQASLDSFDSYSERRNVGEANMSPYYMKSLTLGAFEAALLQKEGELTSYMSRLASMEFIWDSLAEELCEKLQVEAATLPSIQVELEALRKRHSAALVLMGECDEELEELRAGIVDLKEMYREQVNLLVNQI